MAQTSIADGFGGAPLRSILANTAGLALVSALALAAGASHAQGWPALDGAPGQGPGAHTVSVGLGGSEVRNLSLPKGKSAVIELPVDARDVLVSNPKTADVVLSTPRRIYVLGQQSGQTDATFVDGMGRQILRLNIRVDEGDTGAIAQTLDRVLPGSSVHVEAVNDRLILSGEVPTPADADKALRVAAAFVDKPENVINMLAVAAPEQVMLKVRIVEVNRQIVKQLGVNLNALVGQLGQNQFSLANAAVWAVNGGLLGGLTGGFSKDTTQATELQVPCASGTGTCTQIINPGNNYTYIPAHNADGTLAYNADGSPKLVRALISNSNTATTSTVAGSNGLNKANAMLQAFEQTGLLRTLAEPNLTAVSGESAKFLAGGEFPVPVGEDNTGRITVEFKQFGVGLGFTPVVLTNGRISLKLSTEYSELTNVGALSTGSGSTGTGTGTGSTTASSSITVPALTVRRAETVVELPSGGAMMIAGLMESVNKQTLSSLPGLNQLPVLGALFRSRDYLQGETELVVIVTPYLVKPTRPDQIQTPADGLEIADDASTYLLGRLNQGFDKPPTPLPGKSYQGPFGYVVE